MVLDLILITLLGGVASIIIGTFWYSDKTPMGRIHMQSIGFDKLTHEQQQKSIAEAKPHMWKSFLGQFILSSLTAFFIALVSVTGTANGMTFSMVIIYGLLAWICFMVPLAGSHVLWGNVDRNIAWKKFISDSASYLVTIAAVLLIAKLFV
jgi:archaellum biogenesis protein FlaJ (TadC family)